MTPPPPSARDAVVVTGLGLSTGLGRGVETCWKRLLDGERGLRELREIDVGDASVRDGGIAPLPDRLDPARAFADGRARASALFRDTIAEALASAGLPGAVPEPERSGLYLGSSLAASASSEAFWQAFLDRGPAAADYRDLRSYDVEPMLAELCGTFAIRGDTALISSACAAGASSLALATDALRCGSLDLIVAGGGDTLELHTFAGFHALGLLTPEPLRPFGRDRRGMQLGDGFAALVLERERDARRAGRVPIARLVGYGESSDAHNMTQPHPDGEGAALAMQRALRMAGKAPADVDYVNLHATATPSNDRSEYRALARVFGDHLARLRLHAVKPSIGHTLGAAGAVEAVITALVLREQRVPPTCTSGALDAEFEGFSFAGGEHGAPIRCAMSSSFGFGGANTSLLFQVVP